MNNILFNCSFQSYLIESCCTVLYANEVPVQFKIFIIQGGHNPQGTFSHYV